MRPITERRLDKSVTVTIQLSVLEMRYSSSRDKEEDEFDDDDDDNDDEEEEEARRVGHVFERGTILSPRVRE